MHPMTSHNKSDQPTSNIYANLLTPFLTRVKKGDSVKKRVADLKETKTCTGSGPADGAAADGPEEYSKKMLIRTVW